MRREDHGAALRALEAARRLAPRSAQIVLALAHVEARIGNEARGLKLAGRALEIDPGNEEALRLLLTLALRRRSFEPAVRALETAAAGTGRRPPTSGFFSSLGVLREHLGEAEAALAAYREAEAADTRDPRPLTRAGDLLLRLGRVEEGIASLESAARRAPGDPEAWRDIGRLFDRAGRRAEARAAWRGLVEADAGDEEARRRLADLATEAGDFGEAAENVEALLRRRPRDRRLREVLAALREAAGDFARAADMRREDLRTASGGGDSAAWLRVAVLEVRAGDTRGAAEAFDRVMAMPPVLPEVRILAASAFLSARRETEALPLLEVARAAAPSDTRVLFTLAVAFDATGRRAEALKAFQGLIRLDPANDAALNYVGYTWAERGENLTEAKALIERALAIDPDNAAYLDSLGWVLFRLGRYAEALRPLEEALRGLPDDPTIRTHVEETRRRLGDAAIQ